MRWFRAFLMALSETPPDDGRELARNQALADAVFTLEAVRELAGTWKRSAEVMPALATSRAEGRCADELLRILDAG